MKKIKRILALIGVVLLVCLYGSTLVFALMDSPAADGLLRASIAATILIPVLLYAYILIARLLKKRNAMLGASAVFCFVPFILMAAGVVFGILHWAYLFTLILLPMAIFLWDSIRKFLYDIPVPLTVRPWMGPMGKFDKYCEAGIGWFMLRWLTARNLISFFALILLIVNVILKITHTLL